MITVSAAGGGPLAKEPEIARPVTKITCAGLQNVLKFGRGTRQSQLSGGPMTAAEVVYCFGTFTLDVRRGSLRLDDREIRLRAKSYAVLRYLAENAGRLVGKDELIAAVWPGVVVTDKSVARCISDVRQALGDTHQEIIRTVPRRGYLLAAPVARASPTTDREAASRPVAAIPDRPSIAVLPFANLSGDPERDHFAEGVAEEIITALSRISWLVVIARSSSFPYKGRAFDTAQIGRELGVRYVVEGSVRQSGGQEQIAAQLIDVHRGAHLWADRFDGHLHDIFDLQDRVARGIAGVIEPTLQAAEVTRTAGLPTSELGACDLYLRADAMVNSSAALFPEALGLLTEAIERDPRYGPALSLAAVCRLRMVQNGQSTDPEADSLRGADLARRALQASPDDPLTLAQRCSRAHLFRRRHRRNDGARGPRPGAQSQLRSRLVYQQHAKRLGRTARHSDRAHEHVAPTQPPGPHWCRGLWAVWGRASVQPPLR